MWHRIKNSLFIRIVRNKYLLTGVVFLVWITFFDGNSLADLYRVAVNIAEQENQKEYYKVEVKSINEKLNELDSNLDSLEKFASAQYYFKEKDEEIFIVVPKD